MKSTLVVSVIGYIAQGLSLVAVPVFLKTIGAEKYGLMVTVMAFMGYLGFADAGLSWGSMILIAQAHGKGDAKAVAHIVRHAAALALASGLVALLALGAILVAARLGHRLPMFEKTPEADELLLVAGLQLVLNLQIGTLFNLFQGLQEAYWAGLFSGIGRVLGLIISVLVAWKTGSVLGMMVAQLAANLAAGLVALVFLVKRHPWALSRGSFSDFAQYREQLRIGIRNFMLQIGRTLAGTAPTMAISSVLGAGMVPFYTVPSTLLGIFFAPIASWNASMQSAYGAASANGELDWVRGSFRNTLERSLALAALGVSVFVAAGDSFIRLWTHDRLSLEFPVAVSVAAIAVSGAFLGAAQFLLTGMNRHHRASVGELANGLLALALVPVALHLFGLAGVGLGVVAAAAVTSLWVSYGEVIRNLGSRALPRPGNIARVLCCGVCSFLSSAAFSRLPKTAGVVGEWLHLAGLAGAGLLSFALAARWLGVIKAEDLSALARRIRGRGEARRVS